MKVIKKFENVAVDKINDVASFVADVLSPKNNLKNNLKNFGLRLDGELGAGKTTFVSAILRILGLEESVPVLSPTYTYLNEYNVANNWYAHLDMYRASHKLDIADLGYLDIREYKGTFVEWVDVVENKELFNLTHQIIIEFDDNGTSRKYTFVEL